MADKNLEEQDLGNMHERDNVPVNMQEMDYVPGVVQGMDNVTGNMPEMDNVPGNIQEMDNMIQTDNVTDNVSGNVQEMDNVHENVQETDKVTGNVQETDNVTGNVQEMDNVLGNMQEMDSVPVDMQEMDNVPGDMQDMDNVPGNMQEMDSVPGNTQEIDTVLGNSHLHEEAQADENDSVVDEKKKWPGWPGENVFRMLVPVQKVGGIIGRKGEYIKKICEETKARIKILDGPPGTMERTVLISATEVPNLTIPPALDGLLKIHKHIVDLDSDPSNAPSGGTVCTRLLVAATQGGSLIGRQGATIKSIQDDSHCIVRVLGGENLPVFALPDDSVVEIQGEPSGLLKAVELIGTHLRKFLVDRSVIGVFEMQMQMPNARANQNLPPSEPWGPPPSAFPMNHGGHGYESNNPFMAPPPRQYDNYFPPVDRRSLDKQPHPGPRPFRRDMPIGAHTANLPSQQAVIAKVTQNMQIPLSYADSVIGVNGANISYIRRASGATIAVQETRGVPGEMTVEINGSASQVQTAQQLIQNSIANGTSSAPNPTGGPPSQGYDDPYASHGPYYGSSASNAGGGQAGHDQTGDYAAVYGSTYGY